MVLPGRNYADGSDADYRTAEKRLAQYKLVPPLSNGKPFTFSSARRGSVSQPEHAL